MAVSETPRWILRNCDIFINRDDKIGQASEVQTPNIEIEYEDLRNAGMARTRSVAMGFAVEDAEIMMTALDPETIKVFAGSPGTEREFLATGYLIDEDGTENTASYYFRGQISAIDFANWQPGQLASHGFTVKPTYGKFEIGSEVLLEWDDYNLTVFGQEMFRARQFLLSS